MGWFSDKKEDAKDKVKEKTADALKWPVKKIASGAMSKYYRNKGRVAKGTCPECRNPIGKDGYIHKKCWKNAENQVAQWESSMQINNSLYYPNCSHNRNSYSVDHHNQICNKGS